MDETKQGNRVSFVSTVEGLLREIADTDDDRAVIRALVAALGLLDTTMTGSARKETEVDEKVPGHASALLETAIAHLAVYAARKGIAAEAAERQEALNEQSCRQMHQQLLKKNMELREKTMVDELTGLFNRRYFERSLSYDIERFRRYRRPIGVVLFDVDFFKKINDTYGHSVGDAALKHLADLARSTIRSADMVARYGGEEFVLLLPETGSEGAVILAERFRRCVASTPLQTEQGELVFTVSLGVFAIEGDFTGDVEAVMKIVDNALYAAKDAGRNCCVVA